MQKIIDAMPIEVFEMEQERINSYLYGTMPEDKKRIFESEIETDAQIWDEVQFSAILIFALKYPNAFHIHNKEDPTTQDR